MTGNEIYQATYESIQSWIADRANRQRAIVTEYQALASAIIKKRGASEKLDALDATYRPLSLLLSEEREQIEASRTALKDLADAVVPMPEGWFEVATCHEGSYGSQTQPGHYARCHLLPEQEYLDRLGFRTELRCEQGTWQLWADCPPWQFDALRRRLPLNESLACWVRHGANVRVYLPTLPHDRIGGY